MIGWEDLQKILHGEYHVSKLDDGCGYCYGCDMGTQCDKYFLYRLAKYKTTEIGLSDQYLHLKIIDDDYHVYPLKIYLDEELIIMVKSRCEKKQSLKILKSIIIN